MHLDTRRCIAGQTTADGEEEEGMGRRMGGWGAQDREDLEAPSVPQSAVEAPTKRTLRGTQGKRGGAPVNSAVGGYLGNEAKIKRDQRV